MSVAVLGERLAALEWLRRLAASSKRLQDAGLPADSAALEVGRQVDVLVQVVDEFMAEAAERQVALGRTLADLPATCPVVDEAGRALEAQFTSAGLAPDAGARVHEAYEALRCVDREQRTLLRRALVEARMKLDRLRGDA